MKIAAAAVLLPLVLAQASPPVGQEKPWRNPIVIVRPGGLDLHSPDGGEHGYLIPIEALRVKLLALRTDEWPDGRAVAVQEMSFLPDDEQRLADNVSKTLAILADMGLSVERRARVTATVWSAEMIEAEWSSAPRLKPHLVDEALACTEQAISAAPGNQRALVYRVRLLEMRARQRDADRAWRQVVAARLAPKTPTAASSPDLSAAIFGETFAETVRRLHAIEGGQHWPRPSAFWSTQPVYPIQKEAPVARVVIGRDGAVMNAEILRGDPQVARAVLNAARLWFFTAPSVEGRGAVAWIMVIAFDPGHR